MSSGVEAGLDRLVDANLNRLSEGIRVCEDVARYFHNDKKLSLSLKELRHRCRLPDFSKRLNRRDSINDVLRPTTEDEVKRDSIQEILIANYHRAQESSRVLEEICKMLYPEHFENFKRIRYELYALGAFAI